MSLNQSSVQKSEAQQRKPGRSGNSSNPRSFANAAAAGKGGTAPPSSSTVNRSIKKVNGQGGQSRASSVSANSESSVVRTVQNGTFPGIPVVSVSGTVKPIESLTSKSARALPKAPSSQSAIGPADSVAPAIQKGDVPRPFPFQFGTITPGFVNGMQIPARTNSAPPNLDEQKRDQACHNTFRAIPTAPIPSGPKQPQPRKDVSGLNHSIAGEPSLSAQTKGNAPTQLMAPPAKSNASIQITASPSGTQKSTVLPLGGMAVPMPLQQQLHVQFSGPGSQIQSQGPTPTPHQMPLPLTVGNPSQVPQQVFVPGLQSHPFQGQSIGYAPQMGHPQLGNMGISIAPQYAQQAGKFAGPRKTVKITHPDTHEELKLDKRADSYPEIGSSGSSGQLPRIHSSLPPQSQPIPSFPSSHQINYYSQMQPNSYNHSSIFFSPQTSLPLTSSQMTPSSSAQRYNFSVGQGGQTLSFMTPFNTLPLNKTGPTMHSHSEPVSLESSHDGHGLAVSASSVQVTVKPAPAVASSSVSVTLPTNRESSSGHQPIPISSGFGEVSSESSIQHLKSVTGSLNSVPLPTSTIKHSTVTSAVSPVQKQGLGISSPDSVSPAVESAPAVTENRRSEPIKRSDSWKDRQKKQNKKELHPQQHQQAESSDSAGASKSASLKISKNVGLTDKDTRSVVKSPDNTQATLEVVGPLAVNSLPPTNLEQSISAEIGQSEAEMMLAISRIPEAMPKAPTEASQATSEGGFVASEAALDGVQVEERSPYEPSNSEVEGNISINLDTKQVESTSKELALKHEATGTQKHRTSEATLEDHNIEEATSLPEGGGEQTEPVLHEGMSAENEAVSTYASKNMESEKSDTKPEAGIFGSEFECSSSLVESKFPDSINAEVASCSKDLIKTHDEEVSVSESSGLNQGTTPPVSREVTQKQENSGTDGTTDGSISAAPSISKDRPSVEQNRAKGPLSKKKKNIKEILSRADAAGTTSDLYMAYKAPEEKREISVASESTDISPGIDTKLISTEDAEEDVEESEEDSQSKAALDDWEDAAEISTPKLKALENGEEVHGTGKKRYSRDFLLTFAEQCFEIGPDIADAIKCVQVPMSHLGDHEISPNAGRIVDSRPTGGPRMDRRGSGIGDEDRWNKNPGPLGPGQDIRMDAGYGSPAGGFRPGQGANLRVPRSPGGQVVGQYGGGILPGPMQSMSAQGGMARNSPDADRWQRAPGSQKGLIPSPHTPMMHKAENKYEVGKVSDKEEAKQRRLKAILNKLTPQNFDKLFEQVNEVNIDNAGTLTGVISQIFDKALMEPTFCEMYANFCFHLANELPDFSEDNEKITFKRLLLNKCQEEFERGEREQAEANRVEEDGEVKRSEEEREAKKVQARRRMLGNIRLIGELYKKKMLTERIMHECIKKLLGQYQNPDEEDVEALCKLMSTIGEMIDHPKAKEHMDAYFERMQKLSNNQNLSSRVRFMLRDSIDLRKNRWQQRRKIEGPKKIEELHRDAAQERQLQVGRTSRGPSVNMSARRGQPLDYGSRGPVGLSYPGPQPMGGSLRGLPPQQVRGYGGQDVRFEEKHSFESRALSVPLRSIDDDSITLGPQGGLARGMSNRGQPLISTGPLADVSSHSGEFRRMASAGPNGYGSVQPVSDRLSGASAYDQSNFQERAMNKDFRNPDRSFDRPTSTATTTGRFQGALMGPQNASLDTKIWPEERLREMSITAIREFYSANDVAEVASCIKDLNSPNFYPTMVSLWVADSFERKDIERDLLAKLLVNLCNSRDSLLSPVQLIKGFEFVFSVLEDAVYDAPRAAEFLGRILAQVVVENIVSLKEIGRLIHEGGEEPGRLRQTGLASDVLGSILEMIRKDKGESVLSEIRTSSKLRLDDFRSPDPSKSKKLDAFI